MIRDTAKKIKFINSFTRKRLVHLNLQLLYTCNFKCRICDFWKPPYTSYPALSVNQVEVIAQKLKPHGPMIISLGGGEPLLHKGLVDIVRVLSVDNFPVMICNGWYMTKEIAHNLFKAGLYEVSISVDYANAELHDAQRGQKGAFDRAINALKLLHENRVHPDQRVHMISVVMEDNIDQIEPLIKIAKEIGVTYLLTFYSDGRGVKEKNKYGIDIGKFLLELKKKYKEFVVLPEFIEQFTEASENPLGIQPCYAGKNLFNIDSCGNVSRCIDQLDNPAGNILTDDMQLIKETLFTQFKNASCGACWTSCRGNIESLMYGKQKFNNWLAYYHMTKDVPLVKVE